ncbi:MAG TPA: 1-deoxy-D-xylulose-5-phosphate reductoisomerase, partial [Roseiarcus sp.]|nr:1-deoxy-D-xylulose-5-phosphate reductoisomerase [Roseiarcus sp.]
MVSTMRAIRSEVLDGPATEQRSTPKRLVILGATGSIGRSCADVVLASPRRFEVTALAGGRDGAALAKMAIALSAHFVAIADPEGYGALKSGLSGRGVEVAAGEAAVREAALRQAD